MKYINMLLLIMFAIVQSSISTQKKGGQPRVGVHQIEKNIKLCLIDFSMLNPKQRLIPAGQKTKTCFNRIKFPFTINATQFFIYFFFFGINSRKIYAKETSQCTIRREVMATMKIKGNCHLLRLQIRTNLLQLALLRTKI